MRTTLVDDVLRTIRCLASAHGRSPKSSTLSLMVELTWTSTAVRDRLGVRFALVGDLVTKPSAEIFEVAFRDLDVVPEQTVYVGNSHRRDIVGAWNAGIPSVWISQALEPPSEPQPTAVAPSFVDLVGALI